MGAAGTAFPLDSPGKHTDPNPNATYRTASGEIIEDAGCPIVQGESKHEEAYVEPDVRLKESKVDGREALASSGPLTQRNLVARSSIDNSRRQQEPPMDQDGERAE
eukprot:14276936-Heterocapsa_arctica.AAC.1